MGVQGSFDASFLLNTNGTGTDCAVLADGKAVKEIIQAMRNIIIMYYYIWLLHRHVMLS
jgi:hypothetical protein